MVGHIGVELDAAVDGARVADNRVGLHKLLAVLGQAEELVVLANRGERGTLEALLLYAQHVDDVQLRQDGIEVARHVVAAQNLGRRRQQRAGGDGVGLAAHDLKGGDQRAANAGVGDVADDGDLQTVEVTLVLPDGVQVKQSLRGVVMLTVTGADNARGRILRDDVGSTGMLVAHDNAVNLVGVEGLDGIDEALALDRGGRRAAEIEAVGRKTLLGELEGAAGTRRGLVEHVDDGLALERGDLLDGTLVDLGERLGGLEDELDVLFGVLGNVDQMLMIERHGTTHLPAARSPRGNPARRR